MHGLRRLPRYRDGFYGTHGSSSDVRKMIASTYRVPPGANIIVKYLPTIITRNDPGFKMYYWKVEKVRD